MDALTVIFGILAIIFAVGAATTYYILDKAEKKNSEQQ